MEEVLERESRAGLGMVEGEMKKEERKKEKRRGRGLATGCCAGDGCRCHSLVSYSKSYRPT